MNAGLLALENLDVVTGLEHRDRCFARRLGDDGEAHVRLVLVAVLSPREPRDLVECWVNVVELEGRETDVLLDETILVRVGLEDVDLVPLRDRLALVHLDDLLVVEEALRRTHAERG